jgi:eukaryotic-like serine/threonine-protein kinase
VGALKPGYQVTNELTLVRRLGAGGMGTVWVAHHAKLGAEVVLKFLSESLTSDPDACARFSREVSATVLVRSPHVVQTLDHGITESGVPYLVMELLEGDDLSKLLRKRKTLRPHEVQHIVDSVAAALTKVHERGIVHRDIKPANIFMCTGAPQPFVKLVDFGIAKRLEDETMTATHAMLGTPTYMSPEQMEGSRAIDHRSDLWSLGVLTYHMLAGVPPFRGQHIVNLVHAILQQDTPKLTSLRPELDDAVDVWMARALARDPAQRFSSAQEMADALATAFGDIAFATTRRSQPRAMFASPDGVVIPPVPSGPHLPPPAASSPVVDGVGTTLGPSAITQTPYGSSPRMKRWAAAMGALTVVVLILGVAVRVGYGLRPDAPPAAFPVMPALAATGAPAAAMASAASSEVPIASATGSPTNAVALPAASSPPRGRAQPRPAANKKREGRPAGEDDVGF